ncbi:MAG: hypothetical protein QN183_05015 [Armatimonadota bacterium]|nr:hypothetical protein [Armatimonadota bacterium]MDR7534113.1 hypothetical protein [Armatimonadota bacterium]MDR7535708.1 hypothetical protein [Armatimonadota bacterium]
MRRWSWLLALPLLTQVALGAVQAAPAGKLPGAHVKVVTVKVKQDRDAWCFDNVVRLGGIVIAGGRCYTFYVVRTAAGAFLGFGPPGPPMIPPGQLVRLGTPAGAKVKGRLFYLVPIPVSAVVIPVDTVRVVQVVVRPEPERLVVTVPRTANSGALQSDVQLEHPFTQP